MVDELFIGAHKKCVHLNISRHWTPHLPQVNGSGVLDTLPILMHNLKHNKTFICPKRWLSASKRFTSWQWWASPIIDSFIFDSILTADTFKHWQFGTLIWVCNNTEKLFYHFVTVGSFVETHCTALQQKCKCWQTYSWLEIITFVHMELLWSDNSVQ